MTECESMGNEESIAGASTTDRDFVMRMRVEEEPPLTKFCIDKASITICRTSPDGKILDANDHMCRSLGYTREELLSMDIFDVDPILTREIWPEHRKKVREFGTRTFETMHRRKDGTVFPAEVTVNYLTFGGNEVGISVATDITERKRMEEELRLAHAELEKRVAELTRGLLAFSRKQVVDPKPVQIDTIIGHACKLIRRIIGEDIELSTEFADENLLVKADLGQIEQVMMNLATNARDAMPQGG